MTHSDMMDEAATDYRLTSPPKWDQPIEVSVVLPAYNEEQTIERTVTVTVETLESFLPAGSYEVIVAEDGCKDRTPEIASRLADKYEAIQHVHSDERLGRGGALERAFEATAGETLVYFDTDLATDMIHLEELVESVRSGKYDIATGSRWISENVADRESHRKVASAGYNALVRLFLRSKVQDHQCGFKAFDREALFDLLDDVEDEHWFWDTEVLVRGQRRGYKVREFPVDWEPKGDTKVDLVRDVFGMGSQILRTWWEFAIQPRLTRRTTFVGSTLLVVLALVLMTQYIDMGAVTTEMRHTSLSLVVAAGILYLLSWPVRGVRYRNILDQLGYHERVGFLTGAVFISQTGNLVFPARTGDAVRAYVVKARRDIPYPTGFASLAVERVFDLLTITALAGTVLVGLAAVGLEFGGLASMPAANQASGRTALLVSAGVGAAALLTVMAIVLSGRAERNYVRQGVGWLSSDFYADYVANVIEQFVSDVQTVTDNRVVFVRIGATSVVIWMLDVLTALVVLVAFDVSLSLVALVGVGFFAVSVGNLAKVLPLSPGGIGLYEGAFTVVVVGFTPVSWEVALGAAIVDHAVKNLVTIAGGLASAMVLNVSLTTAVEEGASRTTPAQADD